MTKPSLTGTTAGLPWEKAERARGGRVRPRTPPNAPFSIALRFMAECPQCLGNGDLAGAVPETLHLQTRLVQEREVHIGNLLAFRHLPLPPPLRQPPSPPPVHAS